jgi:hypothetical protein
MLGLTTMAIDGGVLQNDRRDDQNVADHAALAAAWAHCSGGNPVQAGLASAARNGFDNNGTSNTVTITNLGSGTYGQRFLAEIRNTRDSSFGASVGASKLRAVGSAVAACTTGGAGSGYAIFAGGECEKTLDWSGSSSVVTGDVHSNREILVGGSLNTVNGTTTYEEDFDSPGSGNSLNEQLDPAPDNPDPYGGGLPGTLFDIEKFRPGGEKAVQAGSSYYSFDSKIDSGALKGRGLLTDDGVLTAGLYFTEQDIDLGDSTLTGTVTFVTSGGQLKLSGENANLTNFDADGLLLYAFADRPCGEYSVAVSGSSSTLTGILYAPQAMVEMSGSGSTNSVLNGSIVGDQVRISGQSLDITYQPFGGPPGDPVVRLLE